FMADLWASGGQRSPPEILTAAERMRHPEDLRDLRSREAAEGEAATRRMLAEGDRAFDTPSLKMFETGPDGRMR
ncbi:hypothetical protein, partial [Mycobacterium sp. KBS0706]|uniref:hypothetical protein n=1 Tax=Mycobacterium sp. KBS0706 TaxID=2578109 RepID=UPI00163D8FCC